MNKYCELGESWGAAIAGSVLLALPVAGGFYRGSFGWMEVVVAVIGAASLVTAAEGFMRSRRRSSSKVPEAG